MVRRNAPFHAPGVFYSADYFFRVVALHQSCVRHGPSTREITERKTAFHGNTDTSGTNILVLLYENIALEAMSSLPGQILDLIVNSRIIVLLNITSLYASAMIPKSEKGVHRSLAALY